MGNDGLLGAGEQIAVRFEYTNSTPARVELLDVSLTRLRSDATLRFTAARDTTAPPDVTVSQSVYTTTAAQRAMGVAGIVLLGAAPGFGLDAITVRALAPGEDGNQLNTPPPTPPTTLRPTSVVSSPSSTLSTVFSPKVVCCAPAVCLCTRF